MNEENVTLYKKMLDFWNKYDGQEFTTENLRSYFEIDEIAKIMYCDSFRVINHYTVSAFIDKIGYNREDLFTSEEADKYHAMYLEKFNLTRLCSGKYLLTLVNDEQFGELAIENLNDDDLLIRAFDMVSDKYLRARIVTNMKDDTLKSKYMKKLPLDYRNQIIMSFEDEYFIEKYISMFKGNKGALIAALDSDEKKIRYLKKYFAVLTKEDKANIISSLEDDDSNNGKKLFSSSFFINSFVV